MNKTSGLLWSLFFFFSVTMISADNFYSLADDPAANLPADKIYPAGRLMPLAAYSGLSAEKLSEQGFTVYGPAYGKATYSMRDDALSFRNLPMACTIRPNIDGKGISVKDFEKKPGPEIDQLIEQVKAEVKECLEKYNSVICWWYITPEELRSWNKNEMEYLKKATAAIRELDPEKRPVFMYEPGHRTAKGLADTGCFQDIIAKGMYTNYSNFKKARIWCKYSTEECIEARNILKRPDMLVLALPEMFQEPEADEIKKIPDWVRHDTYLSLISGARGILIFSLGKRPKFPSYPVYLDEYVKINKELAGPLRLGEVLLFGKPRNDLKLNIISGPKTVALKLKDEEKIYPAINTYDVLHSAGRYFFAVNSAEEAVEASLSGFPADALLTDVFDGKTLSPNLKFAPLEVKVLKLLPKKLEQ